MDRSDLKSIGVGITTFNRPNVLEVALKHWTHYSSTITNLKVVVVDDGSSQDNQIQNEQLCSRFDIHYIYQINQGIATAKNTCLQYLYSNDYIFLADDDTFPVRTGWSGCFIEASLLTQNHHMMLTDTHFMDRNTQVQNQIIQENDIIYSTLFCQGVLLFMTQEALHVVGAFDRRMKFYGHEHSQWSLRAHRANLTPSGKFITPKAANNFFYSLDFHFPAREPPLGGVQNFTSSIETDVIKITTLQDSINYNAQFLEEAIIWLPF